MSAEHACMAMGIDVRGIQREPALYEAGLDALLAVLAGCPPQPRRVMLVGHNPGLEELLVYLADEPVPLPADGKLLPTATLARLALPDDWRGLHAGSARLLSITRPGEMPEKFPYPFPHGREMRERPAYYYTQSSVIPFRVRGARTEILIISSARHKHWLVPKGIIDPGLSPREAAAQEAAEEAGVEGVVDDEAIGRYEYEKWGATCTVEVYPMRVTREMPEAEWAERHRAREWVDPETAAKRLRQVELKPLVRALAERLRARP
jgi:phosphohistidine phosphatase